MSVLRTSTFTVAMVAAIALGMWLRPHVMRDETGAAPATSKAAMSAASTSAAATPATTRATEMASVKPDSPRLARRIQPLLQPGTDVTLAVAGFNSAQQFAAVAHASKNLQVPFVLLKHKVLNEGETLTQAIRDTRPTVDAGLEAARATAEARSDVARVAG